MNDPLLPQGGFAKLVGYRLAVWREDYAEVEVRIGPEHLNRSGVLHGGVLTTIMDAVCGYAGCYAPESAPPRRAFTLSLNAQFAAAAEAGARITARASKTGGGQRIFFAKAEVVDQDGRLIAQGEGVFRYRGTSAPG